MGIAGVGVGRGGVQPPVNVFNPPLYLRLDLRPLRSTRIYRIGKAAKPQIGTTRNKTPVAFTDLAINRILFKKCVILIQKTREYNPIIYVKLQVSVWRVLAALCMAYIYHYDFSVNFTPLRHICLQSTISWQVDLVYRLLQHQGCVEIHWVT